VILPSNITILQGETRLLLVMLHKLHFKTTSTLTVMVMLKQVISGLPLTR